MTVLPIVFSFLIIITIGSSILFDNQVDSARFSNYLTQKAEVDQNYQQQINEQRFSKLKTDIGAPEVKSQTPKNIKEKEEFSRQADKSNTPRDCARLNLFPLLNIQIVKDDLRYKLALHFLHTHYSKLSMLKDQKSDKIFEKLLNQIIQAGKNALTENKLYSLEKLSLQDPFLDKLFFEMLRGSNYYNYDSEQGYPRLYSYLSMDPNENKSICLRHATKEILSTVFNSDIAEDIFEDHHIHKELTKKTLNVILEKHQFLLEDSVNKLFSAKHPKSEKDSKAYITGSSKNGSLKRIDSIYVD